jgi:dienelactone hydrolase
MRTDIRVGELAAWLYKPEGATAWVVMAHGLSAVRDQRLDAYAERFEQAGLAALLFDYRNFGDSGGEPRQVLDIGMQLDDWRAAIEYARREFERVGLFGSSFGGGHVLAIAAEDDRLGAVVAQCPMTDGLLALRRVPPLTSAKLARAALQDVARKAARKPPLQIGLYRPGRKADRIKAPLLVCLCEEDSLVNLRATEKVAEDAPQGELARFPIGHFDIYTGDWFERAVSRQTEFLTRHLDM